MKAYKYLLPLIFASMLSSPMLSVSAQDGEPTSPHPNCLPNWTLACQLDEEAKDRLKGQNPEITTTTVCGAGSCSVVQTTCTGAGIARRCSSVELYSWRTNEGV